MSVDAVRAVARLSRVMERACGELSLAHYRVLAAVADGDERASRVATRLALGKPTISASVEILCRRGLLIRRDVAGDQRAIALHLTAAGERALADADQAMQARLEAILAHTRHPDRTDVALCELAAGLDALLAEHERTRAAR